MHEKAREGHCRISEWHETDATHTFRSEEKEACLAKMQI